MRHLAWPVLFFLLTACATQKSLEEQSLRQLRNDLTTKHPVAYFHLADALWSEGQKDEAVVMFYVGQIRYRAYLNTVPEDEARGEKREYDKLKTELGEPLNQYAARNLDNWVDLIGKALDWHRQNPSQFLPKENYTLLYEITEYDFEQLRQYIIKNEGLIRAQRAEQGLENEY